MADGGSERKKVWKYAVVLFTSALMVLVIAGYSQIKLNNNVSEYEKQLKLKAEQNQNFEVNLNSALQTNEKLNDQLNDLKKELEKYKTDNESIQLKVKNLENSNTMVKGTYEALLLASKNYESSNIVESALILQRCKTQYFGPEALNRYNELVSKTFSPASRSLYTMGRKLYIENDYEGALEKFHKSIDFSTVEYFSDDAYFYAANCQFKLGNVDAGKKLLLTIIEKYPESTYLDEVNRMLGQM